MVTLHICTLAIHPFIWGEVDVAISSGCGYCLTHIYSVHVTPNTTHPHLIYIYLIPFLKVTQPKLRANQSEFVRMLGLNLSDDHKNEPVPTE